VLLAQDDFDLVEALRTNVRHIYGKVAVSTGSESVLSALELGLSARASR
jgi:hypothetical protein